MCSINYLQKDFNIDDYIFVDKELSSTYPKTEIEILEKTKDTTNKMTKSEYSE